ncbi:MAG TPA: peptidoglycan DD-metalloendopeptidase family protein [Bacteroidales bacterium]|nr:peptidoglycan DD-metalloendopeptidase family protein [Bacteroidales bacterium]
MHRINITKYVQFFFIILMIFNNVLSAQSESQKKKLEEQKSELERQIKKTESLLQTTRKNRKNSLAELDLLNAKLRDNQKMKNIITSELDYADAKLSEISRQIPIIQQNIQNLSVGLGKIITLMYVYQTQQNRISYIISASSFNKAFERYQYLKRLVNIYNLQLKNYQSSLQQLTALQKEYEQLKIEKQKLIAQQDSILSVIEKEINNKNVLVNELKKKETNLEKQIKEQKKVQQELNKQIQLIIKELEEARAAKLKAATKPSATATKPVTSTTIASNYRGKISKPVDNGVIVGNFGTQKHPVYPGITIQNNGIDYNVNTDETVKCVYDGTVSAIFSLPNQLKAVIVKHEDFLSVYSNLSTIYVKQNQKINKGTPIGKTGYLNDYKANILHFEIWTDSKEPENPLYWLSN